jgi:SAM-dependent methyltransferase
MVTTSLDVGRLETQVKEMYRQVAEQPHRGFHFEVGRDLATRLGYDPERLSAVPDGAVDSFAGVGYFFDLAALRPGETVVDLGSGAGMDAFYACGLVGPSGRVVGVDFTAEQLVKARRLAEEAGLAQAELREGRIEDLPLADASVDCVISNGVINLCPDKAAVFAEAARVLRPGGRLAIADIVTEQELTEAIVCNVDLWASCIGGAPQERVYLELVAGAGLEVERVRENSYGFLSDQARNASTTYGVKSISLLAVKPGIQ